MGELEIRIKARTQALNPHANLLVCANTHCLRLSIYVGEGNGTPLQYSCLENPMDRGAW